MSVVSRVLAVALVAAVLWPSTAQASESFTVSCSYTRSLKDDPIVYPGQPGASHLHDFFGNRTTDAYSTYSSLRAGGTSCDTTHDKAAYWVPALYVNGVKTNPKAVKAYYYRRVDGPLTSIPKGLKVVAGNSHATTPQSTSVVYFGCGTDTPFPKVNYLPNCTGTGGHLYVHISFPDCMNPTTKALAYHSGSSCPAGYTWHLPQLVERINYETVVDARKVTLASGPYYTYHADFFNAWDQAELDRLVATL